MDDKQQFHQDAGPSAPWSHLYPEYPALLANRPIARTKSSKGRPAETELEFGDEQIYREGREGGGRVRRSRGGGRGGAGSPARRRGWGWRWRGRTPGAPPSRPATAGTPSPAFALLSATAGMRFLRVPYPTAQARSRRNTMGELLRRRRRRGDRDRRRCGQVPAEARGSGEAREVCAPCRRVGVSGRSGGSEGTRRDVFVVLLAWLRPAAAVSRAHDRIGSDFMKFRRFDNTKVKNLNLNFEILNVETIRNHFEEFYQNLNLNW